MDELSQPMQMQLLEEIQKDAQSMIERTHTMILYTPGPSNTIARPEFSRGDLEHLAYITEQLRLKLKMLGAPRIYN